MDTNNPYAELEQKYANNINQQNDLLNQSEQIQNDQINANTQQTLAEIEKQRGYAQQDFNKEARGAYQDYQKLINPYGVQAENVFSNGLGNSGYSETSKLNAYNTYQNRYATARESTDRLMEDFNNQMTEAQLEGNREKAQVALNKLQTQMSNLWQQMNFDSDLAGKKVNYNQWLDEFNYQKQQDEIANQLARDQLALQRESLYSKSSSNDDYYGNLLEEYLKQLNSEDNSNSNQPSKAQDTKKVDSTKSVLYQGPQNVYGPSIRDAVNYNINNSNKQKELQAQKDKKIQDELIGKLWNR